MKSGYGQVGNFHGIWVSGGINRGRYSRFQSCRKLNLYLSCKITWWGGSPSPSHLLRSASAKSLSWPGMCDTSTSMLELEIRRLSFSKRSAIGMVVENSLLDAASAVVLPDNVGMRMGILEPGKNWMAIYTKAICARVSRLEMSFWRLSWTGICRDWKSLCVMGRLNQEHWPEGNTITPPMPHLSPAANASATHNPVQFLFGPHCANWWQVTQPCNIHVENALGWCG